MYNNFLMKYGTLNKVKAMEEETNTWISVCNFLKPETVCSVRKSDKFLYACDQVRSQHGTNCISPVTTQKTSRRALAF